MEMVELLKHELSAGFKDLTERWLMEAEKDGQGGKEGMLGKWEWKIREEIRPLLGAVLEGILKVSGKGYRGTQVKCRCGGEMKYQGDREVRIRTVVGNVQLKRAYYYDKRCGAGQCPLDEMYGIDKEEWSPGLRRVIAALGSEGSFDRAAELLWEVSGIEVSDKSVERVTEKVGRELEQVQQDEREERQLQMETRAEGPRRLYLEVDGGRVPTRDGWREVKLGAVFEGNEGLEGDERGETRYFGGVHDELEGFIREWRQEAEGAGAKKAKEVVGIGDGADWIWNRLSEEIPQAKQILDFYHAMEHAGAVARARWEEGSEEAKRWVEQVAERLNGGKLCVVLDELECLAREKRSYSPVARETLEYYRKNAHRMEYDRYRREGCFIGSGVIESACKHLSNQRLKIAGARWNKDKANDVLRIRIFRGNKQWENYWKRYRKSG